MSHHAVLWAIVTREKKHYRLYWRVAHSMFLALARLPRTLDKIFVFSHSTNPTDAERPSVPFCLLHSAAPGNHRATPLSKRVPVGSCHLKFRCVTCVSTNLQSAHIATREQHSLVRRQVLRNRVYIAYHPIYQLPYLSGLVTDQEVIAMIPSSAEQRVSPMNNRVANNVTVHRPLCE